MSYQKKSLILQQIEQAIRKKAQQKSRTKQHVGRVLQNSIQKKKNVMRSTITKDQKVTSIHKNQNYQEIQKGTDKHISLFNNEQLNTLEGDLKIKKYNNRRLDKLVSLIQYMVSSSEKAIKYISSTNFEAEFALKLYRSDKQNLLSQLKNLTIEDFLESYRGNEKNSASKNEASYSMLVEENNKLKKDILILEKEAQRFMKGSLQQKQPIQMKVIERESAKLKQTIRKLIPFDSFKKYVEILDKETKFQSMELKCQDSSKKVAEIQMVVASLQNQRNAIIQNINRNRTDPKSQRTFKINQIQGQKEQLQKQINVLKSRVNQMKQSSKLIEQYELLKRQNEINNQKLTSLANELSNGTFAHGKRGTQSLVDFIRIKTKDFIVLQRKQQQQIENSQIEREQLQLLIKQKSEELSTFHQRMENIHCEVQNLRQNIEQLNNQKMDLLERCRESEALLQNRENQILILNQKLKNTESREEDKQDIRMKNNQLRKELQNMTKRQEEKQKWLKQKIHSLQGEKQQLEDKLMQLQQFMNHKNDQIEQLIKQKDSREDSTLVIIEKMKIQAKKEINELKETIESLQLQLENQTLKYQQLMKTYEQSNNYYKELTQSYNQKHQQLKELEDLLNESQKRIEELQHLNKKLSKSNDISEELLEKVNELQMENTHLESERQRVKKQNEANIQKLRTIQQQIIKNNYSLQELNNTKNQNVKLNQMISNLKREIDQMHKNENKSKDSTDQLQQTIDKLSAKLKQKQSEAILNEQAIISLKHKIEQTQKRYQNQLSTQSKKLQQAQITSAQINKQNAQIEQNLKDEQDKNQEHLHKIQKLIRQIEELKSEMRSLTIISNEVISQKEQSMSILHHLEEQKLRLQEELNSTKQQIENQIEINQYKAQQYTYLLRQILKGINIQTTDYEHIKTFEELLEFGSKEVVEMRKRQRQQQSNRRRNNKRQQQYNFIEDSDSPTFQNYKTNLFQADGQSNNKNLQLKDLHLSNQSDKLQLNEFQDMQSQKANDSMISEDNKYGMQEFDDLKSQKMNDSMLSNKEANQAQYQTNLLNNQNILKQEDQIISQEKRYQILNLLNQNSQNDLQPETNDAWKLGIDYKPKIVEQVSQLGQFQSQLSSIPQAAQTIHPDSDKGGSQTQQITNQLASIQAAADFKIDQYQEVNSEQEQIKQKEIPKVQDIYKKESKQESGVSDFIARSNDSDVVIYPLYNFKQKSSEQNLRQSQNNSASEFEQFNDMKVGIDNSMISQKPLNLSQLNDMPADNPNDSFISNQNESNLPLEIDQFGEMKNEQMNQSLLSNQHQEKQHEMDEFGDVKEEPMNQSMLSEKEHGLSQFGDPKSEGMNQSMLSQKEHHLQQFGDYKEEPMNQSMLSQKQQKEHGLFQFGELKQEMNQSMFSQKQQQHQKGLSDFGQFPEQNLINSSMISQQKRSLSKGQSEGNNLDDFDEVKSDRMNDSIISEK